MQLITNKSLLEQKGHGSFHFPLLVSHEVLSRYDDCTFLLHWHPEVEITLIIKGDILYRVNSSIVHLKEGDAIFCNSGALHSGKMFNGEDCEYVSITFDPKLIYGYKNSVLYEKYVRPVMQDFSFSFLHFKSTEQWSKEATMEIGNIISIYHLVPIGYEIDIIISLQKIWKAIFNLSSVNESSYNISSLNLSRFRAIISYIELNYSQKITLNNIANHINLCEGECCRLFKKTMNMSIFEYLLEYRIKKACEFLVETTYNISDISEMTGYSDANHFSKAFRKYKNMSPREYRNAVIRGSESKKKAETES